MPARSTPTARNRSAPGRRQGAPLDMFTIVILRRHFEAIIRDMVNALFKSGRSGVLNTAMDFTCSITDRNMQTISTALGLPIHAGAIELIPKAVVEKFGDDIRPGDCFVNNSSYYGNTHCGDFTLCAPVFVEGEVGFFVIARAHLADMGFPTPTTYGPLARDAYEEGLMLPCVRIQRGSKDLPDVIDICKANIRAPEHFYGDYLACLAAVRTGERRIVAACKKYGLDTVEAFLDQYQEYAENMAIAAIRQLPKGRVSGEAFYDSDLVTMPDGIPVRATIEVDPEEAIVEIDLLDNVDNVPLGVNLTESTTTACCRNAVLNILGPDVPRCTGAYRRLRIKMREGAVVGKPRFPAATSSATSNVAQVLTPLIQSLFAEIRPGLGTAFGTVGNPGSCSTISGVDARNGRRYTNQNMLGYWGGPASHGHDGWLTYGGSGSVGVLWQSSVEVVEQQQPVLIERLELGVDTGGAGEWEGAPGAHCVFRPRGESMRVTTNAAARQHPPRGTAGGLAGGATAILKRGADGERSVLPTSLDVTLTAGEAIDSQACGGGGYGDSLARDPDAVRHRVREGWITAERAHDVYGVVIDTSTETFAVDVAATERRRQTLRAATAK